MPMPPCRAAMHAASLLPEQVRLSAAAAEASLLSAPLLLQPLPVRLPPAEHAVAAQPASSGTASATSGSRHRGHRVDIRLENKHKTNISHQGIQTTVTTGIADVCNRVQRSKITGHARNIFR